eukprot:14434684-Alexandrium_andersonii.AAC.1
MRELDARRTQRRLTRRASKPEGGSKWALRALKCPGRFNPAASAGACPGGGPAWCLGQWKRPSAACGAGAQARRTRQQRML